MCEHSPMFICMHYNCTGPVNVNGIISGFIKPAQGNVLGMEVKTFKIMDLIKSKCVIPSRLILKLQIAIIRDA